MQKKTAEKTKRRSELSEEQKESKRRGEEERGRQRVMSDQSQSGVELSSCSPGCSGNSLESLG